MAMAGLLLFVFNMVLMTCKALKLSTLDFERIPVSKGGPATVSLSPQQVRRRIRVVVLGFFLVGTAINCVLYFLVPLHGAPVLLSIFLLYEEVRTARRSQRRPPERVTGQVPFVTIEFLDRMLPMPVLSSLLPLDYGAGKLVRFDILCRTCGRPLPGNGIRCEITHPFAGVQEIVAVGLCRRCRSFTVFRAYLRRCGTISIANGDGTWQQMECVAPAGGGVRLRRAVTAVKRVLRRFRFIS